MKYAIEMGSGAMIYIPSFIKIRFQAFKSCWGGGGIRKQTDSMVMS
jgi:hypothetical protein